MRLVESRRPRGLRLRGGGADRGDRRLGGPGSRADRASGYGGRRTGDRPRRESTRRYSDGPSASAQSRRASSVQEQARPVPPQEPLSSRLEKITPTAIRCEGEAEEEDGGEEGLHRISRGRGRGDARAADRILRMAGPCETGRSGSERAAQPSLQVFDQRPRIVEVRLPSTRRGSNSFPERAPIEAPRPLPGQRRAPRSSARRNVSATSRGRAGTTCGARSTAPRPSPSSRSGPSPSTGRGARAGRSGSACRRDLCRRRRRPVSSRVPRRLLARRHVAHVHLLAEERRDRVVVRPARPGRVGSLQRRSRRSRVGTVRRAAARRAPRSRCRPLRGAASSRLPVACSGSAPASRSARASSIALVLVVVGDGAVERSHAHRVVRGLLVGRARARAGARAARRGRRRRRSPWR